VTEDHPHAHLHTDRNCPGRQGWLAGKSIEPLKLEGNENVADLIDDVYAASGFNARRLAEGAQLFSRMIDDDATVALTLAGAMTPIGMSGVVISLIEAGFIDLIISTGANLYHDLHRPYGFPMVQGHHEADDNAMYDDGVARIYDVFIAEDDTLMATDEAILRAVKRIDYTKPFSSARLHYELGQAVAEDAPHPEKSLLVAAARCQVPVYTSAPGDSSVGMNLVLPYLFDKPVALNPILDVIETTAIIRDAQKNGVIEVGGGSPKNFYLQTQPVLHQMLNDPSKGGHDYFLQLTTDAPHWGGLSGATPSEAKSWGKVKDARRDNVVVYSCASISLPLIARYVLTRNQPRRQRRLMARLDELTEELRRSARKTTIFRAGRPGIRGFADVWEQAAEKSGDKS
jgi:deoxyhypusine synthase